MRRRGTLTALRPSTRVSCSQGETLHTVACATVAALVLATLVASTLRGAGESTPPPMFRQYCFQCHGGARAMGGMSLEQLTVKLSLADNFQQWEKVAAALEQKRMPPKGMPQPA